MLCHIKCPRYCNLSVLNCAPIPLHNPNFLNTSSLVILSVEDIFNTLRTVQYFHSSEASSPDNSVFIIYCQCTICDDTLSIQCACCRPTGGAHLYIVANYQRINRTSSSRTIAFIRSVKFRWREQTRIQKLVDSNTPSDVADYFNKTGKTATAMPPVTIVAVEVIGMSGMADVMGTYGGKVGRTTGRQVGRHWLDFIYIYRGLLFYFRLSTSIYKFKKVT